jgi:tripartite-type tricarboxylate transporter receptor subunit TctC
LAGTPPEIIEKMSRDVNEVIQMPEIVEKFAVGGIYPLPGRQVELARKITVETPIWGKLARDAGLKVQ